MYLPLYARPDFFHRHRSRVFHVTADVLYGLVQSPQISLGSHVCTFARRGKGDTRAEQGSSVNKKHTQKLNTLSNRSIPPPRISNDILIFLPVCTKNIFSNMYIYFTFMHMVTHIAIVWINRVRLPILLVVIYTRYLDLYLI